MFHRMLRLFGLGSLLHPAESAPDDELRVGNVYRVSNPDQGRNLIGLLCMRHNKMIEGSAEWDPATGRGTIRIVSIREP